MDIRNIINDDHKFGEIVTTNFESYYNLLNEMFNKESIDRRKIDLLKNQTAEIECLLDEKERFLSQKTILLKTLKHVEDKKEVELIFNNADLKPLYKITSSDGIYRSFKAFIKKNITHKVNNVNNRIEDIESEIKEKSKYFSIDININIREDEIYQAQEILVELSNSSAY